MEVLQLQNSTHQWPNVLRLNPEPAHPGVNLEVDIHLALQSLRRRRQLIGLFERRHGQRNIISNGLLHFSRETCSQHQNRPSPANAPDRLGFRMIRYTEDVRPTLHEKGGNLLESVTVRIRLDYGHD